MPSEISSAKPRRALGGFLIRKEHWVLTWRARICLALVLVAAALLFVRHIYSFLSVTDRVHGQYLVVEGWIPPETLTNAVAEFQRGGYQAIITSGTVVRGHLNQPPDATVTYANWAASDLRKLGMPEDLVHAAPSFEDHRDRTYGSAVAVKNWLEDHHLPVSSIEVMTIGPHARRSRMLYEEAFGDKVKVGVIAIPSPDYDTKHWWRYSEGVRDVISETVAYLYAKFFFWPSLEDSGTSAAK